MGFKTIIEIFGKLFESWKSAAGSAFAIDQTIKLSSVKKLLQILEL